MPKDEPKELFHIAHYNILAKEIRELFPTPEWLDKSATPERGFTTERIILSGLALNLCKVFRTDNPRFDPFKFLEACSPNNDVYPLAELWQDG